MPPVELFPQLMERVLPPDSDALNASDSEAFPAYEIENAVGDLSSGTAPVCKFDWQKNPTVYTYLKISGYFEARKRTHRIRYP